MHEPFMSVPIARQGNVWWQQSGVASRRRPAPSAVAGTYGAVVYERSVAAAQSPSVVHPRSLAYRRVWARLLQAPAPGDDNMMSLEEVQAGGVRSGEAAAGIVLTRTPELGGCIPASVVGAPTAASVAARIRGQLDGRLPRNVVDGSSRQTPCSALEAAIAAACGRLTCVEARTRGDADHSGTGVDGESVYSSSLGVVVQNRAGERALAATIQRTAAVRTRAVARQLRSRRRIVEATLPSFVIVDFRASDSRAPTEVWVDDFMVRVLCRLRASTLFTHLAPHPSACVEVEAGTV